MEIERCAVSRSDLPLAANDRISVCNPPRWRVESRFDCATRLLSCPRDTGRWALAEMRAVVVRETAHVPKAALQRDRLHGHVLETRVRQGVTSGVEAAHPDELPRATLGHFAKCRFQRPLANSGNLTKPFDSQILAQVGFNVLANRSDASPVIARGPSRGLGRAVGGERGA